MRNVILALLVAAPMAGCADDDAKVLHRILKQCRTNVSVAIKMDFWGKSVEFRCDDMPIDDAKESGK